MSPRDRNRPWAAVGPLLDRFDPDRVLTGTVLPWAFAGIVVATAALLVTWETCGLRGCPDVSRIGAYQPRGAPVLLDRHGEAMLELHPDGQRIVPLDSLPHHLMQAVVAIEDRRFLTHGGVDWARVVPAAWRRQGASTITMQLARTLYPDLLPRHDRGVRRKLLEMRVAVEIERRLSKNEILELYLNYVYFGRGTHGVAEAAGRFFHREPTRLAVEESALLAAMMRAPARYDPHTDPDRALARRNLVLTLQSDQGFLGEERAARARARPLSVEVAPPEGSPVPAPYFVDAVRRSLRERFGEAAFRLPLRVHSTLDPRIQAIVEEELERQLLAIEQGAFGAFDGPTRGDPDAIGPAGPRYLQAAAAVVDLRSGELLAVVGGRSYRDSEFDRARLARRQVGSAFKPFVFATALQDGFVQSQPIADLPFEARLVDAPSWAPGNYDGGFRGLTNMREAIVHSLNVPTARLAMAVGLARVAATARAAGIEDPIRETPATALGAVDLSPLTLLHAFAAFGGLGTRPEALTPVRWIEAEDGGPLAVGFRRRSEVMDARVAYLVTDMLTDVVNRGTGAEVRAAGFAGPAAGKTGTTQDARDVWFVGYTPELAAVVWIGFDQPARILDGATGGRLAAPIWARVMSRIYEERATPTPWERPSGVVEASVDGDSGMYVEEGCSAGDGGTARALFLEEAQPGTICPFSQRWLDRLRRVFGGRQSLVTEGENDDEGGPYLLHPDSPIDDLLGTPAIHTVDGRP